jgi:hypothetical protein
VLKGTIYKYISVMVWGTIHLRGFSSCVIGIIINYACLSNLTATMLVCILLQ